MHRQVRMLVEVDDRLTLLQPLFLQPLLHILNFIQPQFISIESCSWFPDDVSMDLVTLHICGSQWNVLLDWTMTWSPRGIFVSELYAPLVWVQMRMKGMSSQWEYQPDDYLKLLLPHWATFFSHNHTKASCWIPTRHTILAAVLWLLCTTSRFNLPVVGCDPQSISLQILGFYLKTNWFGPVSAPDLLRWTTIATIRRGEPLFSFLLIHTSISSFTYFFLMHSTL